jgi:hypothetical protein
VHNRQLFDARYPPGTSNRGEKVKIKRSSKTMFIQTGHEKRGGKGGRERALTLLNIHPEIKRCRKKYVTL